MSDDSQRWKAKYLESLEQQERQEKRWKTAWTCCVVAWCALRWLPKAATRWLTSACRSYARLSVATISMPVLPG